MSNKNKSNSSSGGAVFAVIIVVVILLAISRFLPKDEYKVGDSIKMGSYDNGDEEQPISWRILEIDKDNGRMLVITIAIIDGRPFDDSEDGTTYENSSIREWLNNDFYDSAFTNEEKDRILESQVLTDDSTVTDKIFLLSSSEANKYFKYDSDRKARARKKAFVNGLIISSDQKHRGNAYAYEKGDSYSDKENYASWWLRDLGHPKQAFNVGSLGKVYDKTKKDTCNITDINGVRPAMWVKINAEDESSSK